MFNQIKNKIKNEQFKTVRVIGTLASLITCLALMYFSLSWLMDHYRIYQHRVWAENKRLLLKVLPDLVQRWTYGDIEESFIQERKVIGDFFWRCNPNYLSDFLEGKFEKQYKIPSTFQVEDHRVKGRVLQTALLKGKSGVLVELSLDAKWPLLGGDKLNVFLENVCREVYLPKRTYAYGLPKNENEDDSDDEEREFIWDNFDQDIYVDKFLVTKADIALWKTSKLRMPDLKDIKDIKDAASPATHLSLQEMKNYCVSQGKELIDALVYDAASFYPMDLEDFSVTKIERASYPWTRHKSDVEVVKYRKLDEEAKEEFKFSSTECESLYHRDCLKKMNYPWKAFNTSDTSWIGMNQILGGPMEVMENPLEPEKNLKMSSWHFPADSLWHELGRRSNWEEEKNYDVAFRCMRKIKGEQKLSIKGRSTYTVNLKDLISVNDFENRLFLELSETNQVTIKNWELVNPLEAVIGPDLTWQEIARFSLLDNLPDYCLFMKYPSRKIYNNPEIILKDKSDILGTIKLIGVDKNKSCQEAMFVTEGKKLAIQLSDIYLAHFSLNREKKEFLMDLFVYDFNSKKYPMTKIVIPLMNASFPEIEKTEHLEMKTLASHNFIPGVWILRSLLSDNQNPHISKPILCGGKNQKPCPQGKLFPTGFCQIGLTPYENSEKEWICLE